MNEMTKAKDSKLSRGFFSDDFDNLFEGFFRPMSRFESADNSSLVPAVDVVDEDDKYVVSAEIPGVDRKDIEVSVNDGVLTINAERKAETEDKDEKGRVIRRESRYGKYVRSMQLGSAADATKIEANYKDGILKLVVPKSEAAKPQKIEVKVD